MDLELSSLHGELAKDIANKTTGHAYLFCGDEAKDQASLFTMALNCLNSQKGQPCLECENCKKIAENTFPDVHIITPDRGQLRIEQMRRMQEDAGLRPFSGAVQVFILENADTLKDAAANSLLKILEEPPPDTYFILTTDNADKILPTVLSRCRKFTWNGSQAVNIDELAIEANLQRASQFLDELPVTDSLRLLLFGRNFEKDKDGLLFFLLALMRILTSKLKGEIFNSMSPALTLKAALFTERTISLLGQNVNHRLLADVYFLRLWRMFAG